MAIDRIVLFEGQEFYVVGEAIGESLVNPEESRYFVCVAITKIEPASPRGPQRVIWLPLEAIVPKPSGFNYRLSEWYRGVNDGSK